MSVSTRVVNGDLGYLALVVSEAEFLVQSRSIAYVAPTSPPKAPVHPAGATSAKIMEINCQYLQDQKTFDTYCEVSRTHHAQVIMAVPDKFVSDLKHATLGNANVTGVAHTLVGKLWGDSASRVSGK